MGLQVGPQNQEEYGVTRPERKSNRRPHESTIHRPTHPALPTLALSSARSKYSSKTCRTVVTPYPWHIMRMGTRVERSMASVSLWATNFVARMKSTVPCAARSARLATMRGRFCGIQSSDSKWNALFECNPTLLAASPSRRTTPSPFYPIEVGRSGQPGAGISTEGSLTGASWTGAELRAPNKLFAPDAESTGVVCAPKGPLLWNRPMGEPCVGQLPDERLPGANSMNHRGAGHLAPVVPARP
jgi:hypothetical protein